MPVRMPFNASASVRDSSSEPERIGTQTDILGESPLWDDRAQCLYWLDIRRPALRRLCPATGRVDSWSLPGLAGSIALTDDHRLLVALPQQIALFDPATGTMAPFVEPPPQPEGHRFNDGRCDAQGRFWVGTIDCHPNVGREAVVGSLLPVQRPRARTADTWSRCRARHRSA